jgi:hypothetical protein
MKTLYSILFICCSFFCATAQISQLQFLAEEPLLCIDSLTPLIGYHNWEAYQTLDGTWNGPRDSTICISLYHATEQYNPSILFDEIDLSRPVYIRAIFDSLPVLAPHKVYYVYHDQYASEYQITDTTYCENGWCEGIMVGIQTPADDVDSTDLSNMKYYSQNFDEYGNCSSIDMCVPTELFDSLNYLKEFVIKVKYDGINNENSALVGIFDFVSTNDCTILIDSTYLADHYVPENDYYLNQGMTCYDNYCYYGSASLIKWNGIGIPSDTNMYYLDVQALYDPSAQQIITIDIGDSQGLIFEPFTQIRGALVDGSDSIRHTFHFNNWGQFCLGYGFFEFITAPGGTFSHHKGMIATPFGSCMRFEYNATLQISENASLHYGMYGNGMLAMNAGSKIDLQNNASLHLGNIFSLWDYPGQTNPENIHIYLKKGNALVFDPYSSIVNKSLDHRMKLVVHLQGGYLDISNLDENSKKHLVVEYDRPNAQIEILSVYGNPLADLNFTLHSNESGIASAEIFDLMGKKVMTLQLTLNEGFNQIQIPLPSIATGTYVLQIASNKASTQTKFMKE